METAAGESSHDGLCEDVLVQILVRLPSESVLRCRAVCKSWRRITTDRAFLAAHAARRPREMIVITESLTVSSIPLSLEDDTGRRRFLCDPTKRANDGSATWCSLLYSLDGLLVLRQRPGLYIICNPITRQWTNLPVLTPEPCFTAFPCGFYFHSSSGEYRLLCHGVAKDEDEAMGTVYIWYMKHDYYILSAGGTLPRLLGRASFPAVLPTIMGYERPTSHGGILHWFCSHPQATSTGKILAFHTVSETFQLMSRPPGVTIAALVEIDGALSAATMPSPTRLDIWVLQDYEAESWTLRLRVEVSPPRRIRDSFVSMAISAGGGAILFGDPYCPVVRLCDLKEKGVRKEMYCRSAPLFLVFSESLVSHAFFESPRCPDLESINFPD
ncbi:F-box protein At5g49610-like [Phragmites australis]|uniref:F-box protein At5g49610-like n=1 Tax=Phragmites australis TaxID=29695 RepID=UPI002D7940E1|nr:F-box protein At5g49610-like [Phragmites australis]